MWFGVWSAFIDDELISYGPKLLWLRTSEIIVNKSGGTSWKWRPTCPELLELIELFHRGGLLKRFSFFKMYLRFWFECQESSKKVSEMKLLFVNLFCDLLRGFDCYKVLYQRSTCDCWKVHKIRMKRGLTVLWVTNIHILNIYIIHRLFPVVK